MRGFCMEGGGGGVSGEGIQGGGREGIRIGTSFAFKASLDNREIGCPGFWPLLQTV